MKLFFAHKPGFEKNNQSGFTLLELLLVIGVASVLFLGISKITSGWVDSEVSSGAGQHLSRVSNIVQNYVEANWKNDTNPLVETADALANPAWANLKSALDQEGLLSNGQLRSPLNAPMKIAYLIDIDPVSGNKIYRTTIYATQTLPYKRVIEAARQTGNTGGLISFFPDGANAFGAFGQWKISNMKLLPAGLTFPCVANKSDACLLAVISYNQQMLCGPFLYRSNVEASGECPGGNTMSTDLNMATDPVTNKGHNINNAGTIQATNVTALDKATLGATTVAGTATFNGETSATRGMTVNDNLNVTGDANFSGTATITTGTLNTTNMNANTVQTPNLETNEMHAQNMTMTNGKLAVDNDVSINGNVTMNGAGTSIIASTVSAGQINTGGGDVTVGTMNVMNTMDVTGQINIDSGAGTLASDNLVVDKCLKIKQTDGTYKSYGGCP